MPVGPAKVVLHSSVTEADPLVVLCMTWKEQEGEKRVMAVLHFAGSISLPSQLSLSCPRSLWLFQPPPSHCSLMPFSLKSCLSSSLPTQHALSMDAPIQGKGFVRICTSTSGENGVFYTTLDKSACRVRVLWLDPCPQHSLFTNSCSSGVMMLLRWA